MSATAFERIIDKLENVKVTHNGTQARAKCPAHAGDSDTSLAIRRVEGKALIHCFADCPVDDVLASLEMRRSDLYDDGNGYTYTYPDGSNVHRSYTRDGKKRFYQSGNTGSGGTATTLYRADAVEAAKLAGTTIWFAEGEDDVHALEAIGLVAVTARGGAGNVHKCDLTPLHGANVVVVVDKDKAGDKRAATISNMLSSKAKLAWVQAKTGKDAADHIAAGHGIADFEQYIFPTDEAPDVDQPTQTRYDQLMLACLDSKGLRNIPSPLPIIDNYLFRDSLAWIGGKPGHCKSFVAAEMACCVGTGRDWFGNPVKQGKVLYLIAEGASGFSDRIETWEEYYGTDATNVTFLPVPIQFKADVDVAAFGMLIRQFTPDLVVIDTQARVTVGYKENDSTDMGEFVDRLEDLRRATKTCILLVHHEPRNGEHLRGSIALEGAATSILRAFKEGNQVMVETQKQKDIEEPWPFDLQLFQTGKSAVLLPLKPGEDALTQTQMFILQTLQDIPVEWVSKSELMKTCGLADTTFYRNLNVLIEKKYVEQKGTTSKQLRYIPDQDRML